MSFIDRLRLPVAPSSTATPQGFGDLYLDGGGNLVIQKPNGEKGSLNSNVVVSDSSPLGNPASGTITFGTSIATFLISVGGEGAFRAPGSTLTPSQAATWVEENWDSEHGTTASAEGATVTFTDKVPGVSGNEKEITIAVGSEVTRSGPTLTGGSLPIEGSFKGQFYLNDDVLYIWNGTTWVGPYATATIISPP